MNKMDERIQILTVAQSGTYSTSFNLLAHEIFVGVDFPNMDGGNIGIEYSRDSGNSYSPVLNSSSGDDLLVVKSGSDPGVIDISDFIRFAHSNSAHMLRFTCAEQTSGAVSIVVLTRG